MSTLSLFAGKLRHESTGFFFFLPGTVSPFRGGWGWTLSVSVANVTENQGI